MSHVRLWEHIWNVPPSAPFDLIKEDDARIPSKLEQKMAWLHSMPKDADMVILKDRAAKTTETSSRPKRLFPPKEACKRSWHTVQLDLRVRART